MKNFPMFIRSIRFSNFRSFDKEQTVEFGSRNIIVGKNGAGKSNFLLALSYIFLVNENSSIEVNDVEGVSTITLDIDNHERRFALPVYFSISAVIKNGTPEYFVNKKPYSKDELASMFENAGFNSNNIVMQGKITGLGELTEHERYEMICEIAGIRKYEESRTEAMKYLNDENDSKIESMLMKLKIHMQKDEDMKKKYDEYTKLSKRKKMLEYELINYDIDEINKQIDNIIVNENDVGEEINENLLEYELMECREKICKIRSEIDVINCSLSKVNRDIINGIFKQLNEMENNISNINNEIGNNNITSNNISNNTNNNTSNNINNNINNNISIKNKLNIYYKEVDKLNNKKNELVKEYERLKNEESNNYVVLQALKYWEAGKEMKSDVNDLKKELETKRVEIKTYSEGSKKKYSEEDLIMERKKLWIERRDIETKLKKAEDTSKELIDKSLYVGKQSINIYEGIRKMEGVCGIVSYLFNIPDEIYCAYKAVTRNSMFWIVVENDNIASELVKKVNGRVTFIALNVINARMEKRTKGDKIEDDKLIKLCDVIKSENKYRNILEFICKDYYVCSDYISGIKLSEKYGINVVDFDGSIISKNGPITGGHEAELSIVEEMQKNRIRVKSLSNNLFNVQKKLEEINKRIMNFEIVEDDSRTYENLKAYEKYLEWKIKTANAADGRTLNKEICQIDVEGSNVLQRTISNKLTHLKTQISQVDAELVKQTNRKDKYNAILNNIIEMRRMEADMESTKKKEEELLNLIYGRQRTKDILSDPATVNKHVLINKRNTLMTRIGIIKFNDIVIRTPKPTLIRELKEVNGALKKYAGYENIPNVGSTNFQDLWAQLEDLKGSKTKILQFIAQLDEKKEDTLELTFSMIAGNYSYFYSKLTGRESTFTLCSNRVEIAIDGTRVDSRTLSGGQKSMVALALIFAIQKNDPSPFYIFDEIDANLDLNACNSLYTLLKNEKAQFFITTFKEESLGSGERFYGVAVQDKTSFVGEIDYNLALESLRY